jgi:hypothetical protein
VVKAPSDFEATWYPRVGKAAAEELRRYRRIVWVAPVGLVCVIGAGLLIGTDLLGDVLGTGLAVGFLVSYGAFIRAQWRTAAAVSVWFGVPRMRWLPQMTPERFDRWRQRRGLRTPEERLAPEGSGASSSES